MNPLRFLPVAQAVADLSRDPSTKVGAIILDADCNMVSVGFNGFPRGVIDSPERYADRAQKYPRIAHAEMNAIAQAARVGARTLGTTLLVTALYPCSICARMVIQAGISRVYAPRQNRENVDQKWIDEAALSAEMFREAGVEVIEYDAPP